LVLITVVSGTANAVAQETPADSEGRAKIASVEFVDTPITSIFRMISDVTGWSILLSPEVSKNPPRINLWAKSMSGADLLDQVTMLGGLVAHRDGKTVRIMQYDEYARAYGVKRQVVQIRHVTARHVAPVLQPMVIKDQHKILVDEDGNRLVLLVPEDVVDSLLRVIAMVDVPFAKEVVRVVMLKNRKAAVITPTIEQFVGGRGRPVATAAPRGDASASTPVDDSVPKPGENWQVQFMVEPALNAMIIRGITADVERLVKLVEELDAPDISQVHAIQLRFTSARRTHDVLRALLGDSTGSQGSARERGGVPGPRIASSEENNQIILDGTPEEIARVSRLINAIDKPLPPGTGGVRVIRLENATSTEVVGVLQALIDDQSVRSPSQGGRLGGATGGDPSYIRRVGSLSSTGHAGFSTQPAAEPSARTDTGVTGSSISGAAASSVPGSDMGGDVTLALRITDAPEINAVIIRGSAGDLQEMASIIEEMDAPREQVLLEVTMVRVRSTTGFDFGVELAGSRLSDTGTNAIGFNTFGIGQVNSSDGSIRIASPPPFGLNAAIFNADDMSLVLNALKTVGDSRITSRPKILVEDNSLAEISEVEQEPFEVTSQGDTTSITSFGGFVDAGTRLAVIPHIAKTDWLRLQYQIALSSFRTRTVAQTVANLPPPRQESTSNGVVRIPHDHVVALGGLVSTRSDNNEDGIPFIWDIPIIGDIFKRTTKTTVSETLFIFIRPIILREPGFSDLKYLSSIDVRRAKLENQEYPKNELILVDPRSVSSAGDMQ